MTRAEARAGFSTPVRLRLVEQDVDTLEESHERFVAALDRLNKVLIGILVATTTASIALALNVILLGSR